MHLHIYFPGNSSLNKNELEEFSKMFKENDLSFYAHEWNHWEEEDKDFDLELELKRVSGALMQFDGVKSYSLYAKSIGTYFASELISSMIVQPTNIFLMGIPTGIGKEKTKVYESALKRSGSEIKIIQNSKDPYGPISEVKNILGEVNYELIERDADDHRYSCADEVKELI